MTQGFFVNSANCYGCKSCQVACANEKVLTPGVFIRRVREVEKAGGHAFVSMSRRTSLRGKLPRGRLPEAR